MATELESRAAPRARRLEDAVARAAARRPIKQHKRIIFNGNGYSDEWQKEAGKRGLLNLKNTVDALPEIVKPAVVKTFEKFKVLNERELHARYEMNLETYCKTINVEAQLMVLMANRYILPAALEYQKRVGQSVAAAKAGGVPSKEGKKHLTSSSSWSTSSACRPTRWRRRSITTARPTEKHAKYMRDTIVPAMATLRELGDQIEVLDPARALAAADVPGDAVCQVEVLGSWGPGVLGSWELEVSGLVSRMTPSPKPPAPSPK